MSESDLQISTQDKKNHTTVKLAGQIDAKAAPNLNHKLQELINQGKTKLILDMGGVDYISSAGIGTFLAITKAVKGQGGQMILAGVIEEVQDVFDLLKIDQVFTFAPSVAEAEKKL
jgi:anti-sigma B factor antagonist